MKTYVATTSLDNFELRYYKTVAKGLVEEKDLSYYGVYVEKHEDGKLVEEMGSGPLCEDDVRISQVIELLAENSVTPFALLEVLDEMEVLEQAYH